MLKENIARKTLADEQTSTWFSSGTAVRNERDPGFSDSLDV